MRCYVAARNSAWYGMASTTLITAPNVGDGTENWRAREVAPKQFKK